MRKRLQLFVAVFMVFAVTTAYSFDTQLFRAYAAGETSGQTAEETEGETTAAEAETQGQETDSAEDTAGDTSGVEAAGADEETETAEDSELTAQEAETQSEAAAAKTAGDFMVTYDATKYTDAPYTFDEENGVLYITGDVTVEMAEGKTETTQNIIVRASCKVELADINIKAAKGPAILIESPYDVEIVLAEGSVNKVTGAEGVNINHVAGSFAGIEVEFEYESGENPSNNMASLTISGNGSLEATGGKNAAGIGGSNSAGGSKGKGLYGNITINGGNITATAPGSGAGIGSSNNPNDGTSIGSFKTTGGNSWGTITINGGTISAESKGNGAGIGGGNHFDSGKIIINGGTITKAVTSGGGAGIGAGLGSSNKGDLGDPKGHGYYYADIEINGGTIEYAKGGWLSAGIGGGYECDAKIKITGGTIVKAIGGNGNANSYYQGAPGIGAGYQGNLQFEMTGGTIKYAEGGWSAPGIGYGAGIQLAGNVGDGKSKRVKGCQTISAAESYINISGGTIEMAQGGLYGAGIGGGNGCPECHIVITGGNITAKGYASDEDEKMGGAGIGSGVGAGSALKYKSDTDLDISITGGIVVAVGGWGASGIGSGAQNKTADTITIAVYETELQAYSDGTKFAIDTRQLNDDGTTTSITKGRSITGDVLQGTFVHQYDQQSSDGEEKIHQGTEGLSSIKVINDKTGEVKELKLMPKGYRSFATNVNGDGAYTVYSDDGAVSNGSGRYFNKCVDDVRTEYDVASDIDILERNVQYKVTSDSLCDNFYLFPVKTVVVEKKVQGDGTEGLDTTVYFALKSSGGFAKRTGSDAIWTESIKIVDGVAQGRAIFVSVNDEKYDVWEINGPANDNSIDTDSPKGAKFGNYILSRITTQHGDAVELAPGTVHDTSRGITYTVSENGGELTITASMDSEKRTDTNSVTLSLFADGELTDYPSEKLNASDGWEQSWTVPASKEGNKITYSVADTSNNAMIDDSIWNDEVKVINTYEKARKKLIIKKDLEDFVDHGNEDLSNVNATFVFKISGEYEKNGETKTYTNVVSMDFTKKGEWSQEVTVEGIPSEVDVEKLNVEEIYSGNYAKDAETAPEITPVEGEDGVYEITFDNKWSGDIVYKGGVTNKYEISGGVSRYLNPLAELTGGNQ